MEGQATCQRLSITPAIHYSNNPFWGWSPRLVSRQRRLLFTEALICLSYLGLNGRPGR